MLRIEEVHVDSASCSAPTPAARRDALRVMLGSILQLSGRATATRFRYVENPFDDRTPVTQTLRVTTETAEEIDAIWMQNIALEVDETELETFVNRCAVAIRPGVHCGRVELDDLAVTLVYDACEPDVISWRLPAIVVLSDPELHAAALRLVIARTGVTLDDSTF